jgi:hypothetical protein
MSGIRKLVSRHPLNAQLREDRESWLRLCKGFDDIQDAETLSGRLATLDVVRDELAMTPVGADGDENDAALTAGLLVSHALPALITSAKELAAAIDEEMSQRDTGWTHLS